MLGKQKFRIDFVVNTSYRHEVKMSEDAVLPYRTEEPRRIGSLVFDSAWDHIRAILGPCHVRIVNVYPLTEYEEIPSVKNTHSGHRTDPRKTKK